jgi:exodeoxyribonuclease III
VSRLRITSWNVNSLRARLGHVARFAREAAPDVLCLQETKLAQDQFSELIASDDTLREQFPHLAWWGQPTYNGVAILSKLPLEDVRAGFAEPLPDGLEGPHPGEPRILTARVAGIRLYDLYCPNGTALGSPRFFHKLRWYRHLRDELDRLYDPADDLLVVGDMNVAPDDLDVWDPFKCDGVLLCHPDERASFAALLEWGLADAFRELNPYANQFTWWDYQKMGFQRGHGLRIDHTLLSRSLMQRLAGVTLHRDVRGWDQPSDHAPVSVDLRV